MRTLHREHGSVLIQVIIGLVALIGFSAIVIDQGLAFVGRRQLQNVADAGALAGAIGYTFDPRPGLTAEQAGHASATTLVNQHRVLDDGAMGVTITFDCPAWMTGETGCVRVDVHRDGTNSSAMLPVFMSQVFGRTEQRGRATATAQAANANWTDCLKPWMIPDKFVDVNGNGRFDLGVDQYEAPGWTTADIGTVLTLSPGNPQQAIAPSDFFQLLSGNEYPDAITGCTISQGISDTVEVFPGASFGITRRAVEDLIAANNGDPVTVLVGMFDPAAFAAQDRQSGKYELQMVNMMGFRITGMEGNALRGTIVQGPAQYSSTHGSVGNTASLIKVIRLVQ